MVVTHIDSETYAFGHFSDVRTFLNRFRHGFTFFCSRLVLVLNVKNFSCSCSVRVREQEQVREHVLE